MAGQNLVADVECRDTRSGFQTSDVLSRVTTYDDTAPCTASGVWDTRSSALDDGNKGVGSESELTIYTPERSLSLL